MDVVGDISDFLSSSGGFGLLVVEAAVSEVLWTWRWQLGSGGVEHGGGRSWPGCLPL